MKVTEDEQGNKIYIERVGHRIHLQTNNEAGLGIIHSLDSKTAALLYTRLREQLIELNAFERHKANERARL